jgi:hypothetical protein
VANLWTTQVVANECKTVDASQLNNFWQWSGNAPAQQNGYISFAIILQNSNNVTMISMFAIWEIFCEFACSGM